MNTDIAVEASEEKELAWGWYLVLGIALVMFGTIAIAAPVLFTGTTLLFLGWLLIFGGIVQTIYSFWTIKEGNFLMELLIGILYLIFGILLVNNLLGTAVVATSLIAIFFLIEGTLKIVLSLQVRPMFNWGWMLAGGIISIFFSLIILFNLAATSLMLIGLLIGLNMLFGGSSMIIMSFVIKKGGLEESRGMVIGAILLIFLLIFITLRILS